MKAVTEFFLLIFAVFSGFAAGSIPFLEWSVRIPDHLTLNPSKSDAPFLPVKEFLTRSCQEKLPRIKGGVIRYRIVPAMISSEEQILEFEYPMTVL